MATTATSQHNGQSAVVSAKSARLMRLATYASVSVAGVLIAAKIGAWLATDSVSLLSTLVDSFLDAAASMINLFAVRTALMPADADHRFGHGKAEPLAGLAQSAFIAGSAAFLLLEAAERLINPKVVANIGSGIMVMGLSVGLTLILVAFQLYVVRKTKSVAIKADSLHYQTDLLVNLGVIVSLLLVSQLGWGTADPLFAVAIAVYILWGAWKIGRESLSLLMDEELPPSDRKQIEDVASAHPHVRGIHDLRTRSSGQQAFIQFHIELPKDISLREAHDIADEVMAGVIEVFPRAEVLIHQDPEGIFETRDNFTKN